jgi:hypothetical protein
MSKLFLKVKIKSLAEEARIIRLEEQRRKGPKVAAPRPGIPYPVSDVPAMLNDQRRSLRWRRRRPLPEGDVYFALRAHRIHDVRTEARAAQLAYGFARGRPYRSIENNRTGHPPIAVMTRVGELLHKYCGGPRQKIDAFKIVNDWIDV